MSDESDVDEEETEEVVDDKPTYQVLVTRVQEGMLLIEADSADEAKALAEDEYGFADWETVHYEVVNAELSY